jgi:hypothetical protein
MAVARFSLLLFLALCTALPALAQDAAEWERNEGKSVVYANLVTGKNEIFGFFCRKTQNTYVGGIVLRMPSFRILIRDEERYSLNIVIDGSRDSVTLTAKDIDLWFEAKDLNQQLALGRIFDSVKASHQLELAVSAIGWRERYQFNGADIALNGLMEHCL